MVDEKKKKKKRERRRCDTIKMEVMMMRICVMYARFAEVTNSSFVEERIRKAHTFGRMGSALQLHLYLHRT